VSRGSDLAPLRDSCHLKVSTSRSQTCTNLTSVALTVPKIFHGGKNFKGVHNLKVGHVTLTTPLSGMVCYRQAGTCYDKPTHQIWSA